MKLFTHTPEQDNINLKYVFDLQKIQNFAYANGIITDIDRKENKLNILYCASEHGNMDIIDYLNNNFDDINLTVNDIRTYRNYAITLAVQNNHLKVIKYFVEYFDICKEDFHSNENLSFIEAAQYGHLEIVKYLTNKFTFTFEDIFVKYGNYNAFEVAVNCGHLDIITYLTEHCKLTEKATENDIFPNGFFSDSVVRDGHVDVAKFLVSNFGVPRNGDSFRTNVTSTNLDLVKYLVKDLKYRHIFICKINSLRIAASNGYLDVVKFLKENSLVNSSDILHECRENKDIIDWITNYDQQQKLQNKYDNTQYNIIEMINLIANKYKINVTFD